MADSSSTSSFSEALRADHPGDAPSLRTPPAPTPLHREEHHPHRYPWALLLAFLFVALAELAVRRIDPHSLILTRDDSDQARAVRDQISLDEPIDVAFVGSSMMYQGVNGPALQSQLSKRLGRDVIVRNEAIRGGRIDLFAETVRHLLRQRHRPKLIVVGTSMRDLRDYDLDFKRMSMFWTLGDFARNVRAHGLRQRDHLPTVLRNEVEPYLSILKYRDGISIRLKQRFVEIDTEPLPARGDSPPQHSGARRDTLLTMDEFKSSSNKRRMTQAYRIDLPPEPQAKFVACVDDIIAECKAAGVEVVFLDLPISEPMQGLLIHADRKRKTDQIEPKYRETMQARCTAGGVPFVSSESLGLSWTLTDFFDSQHLNYAGAVKLGDALLPQLTDALSR